MRLILEFRKYGNVASALSRPLFVPLVATAIFLVSWFHYSGVDILDFNRRLFAILPGAYFMYLLTHLTAVVVVWVIVRKVAMYVWFDALDRSERALKLLSSRTDKRSLRAVSVAAALHRIKLQLDKLNLSRLRPAKITTSLFLCFLVLLPMKPTGAAPADDILEGFQAIQEDVILLVRNDESLAVLNYFLGSIISLVKADPLSLDLLDAASEDRGESFTEIYERGLDFAFFSGIGASDADERESNSQLMPDSFLGFMSLLLSLIFQVLLVSAMVIRIILTSAMAVSNNDPKGGVVKVALQSISGLSALFLTMPYYKGFNIIGVFLASCIVFGVGIANFAVILYFKFILVGNVSPPMYNPQTDAVFTQLVDRYVCVYAANGSTAGSTEIEPRLVGSEIRLGFGRCGSFVIKDLSKAKTVRSNAGRRVEDIESFKDRIEAGAKDEYLKALTVLISDVKNYAESVVELKNMSLSSSDGRGALSLEELMDYCRLYIARPDDSTAYGMALNPEMRSLCNVSKIEDADATKALREAKETYSNSIAQVIRETISALELHYNTNDIKTAQNRPNSEINKNFSNMDLSDVSVDAPITWASYSAGWIKYPKYVAQSRAYGKAISSMLNLKVEGGRDIYAEDFASGESEDVIEAMAFNKFIQEQINDYEETLVNPIAVIESMANGGDAMIEASTDLTSAFMTLDTDAVQLITYWVAKLIIVDQGENVVTSLTDSGHTIIELYLMMSAAKEMLDWVTPDTPEGSGGSVMSALKTIGGPVLKVIGLPVAAAVGAMKPYIEFMSDVLPKLFWIGNILAFVVPTLVYYFFTLALLKFITQLIKTSIFISAVPLKIFESSGQDFVSKDVLNIILMAIVTGASPMVIIGSFMVVEQGMTSIVNVLQVGFYEFMMVTVAPYTSGIGAMIFVIIGLILIPFIVMLWMYSFPIAIQEALPQFLSINLSNHAAEGRLTEVSGYFANMGRSQLPIPGTGSNGPDGRNGDDGQNGGDGRNGSDGGTPNNSSSRNIAGVSDLDSAVSSMRGRSDMLPIEDDKV